MVTIVPSLIIASLLGGAFVMTAVAPFIRRITKYVPSIVLLFNVLISLGLLVKSTNEPVVEFIGGWEPPYGINLVAGPMGSFLALIISLIAFLISLSFLKYEPTIEEVKFMILFMLSVLGASGLVLTGDIFNLFVFLELMTISAYALVAYGRGGEGAEAGFKYLLAGSVAANFYLIESELFPLHGWAPDVYTGAPPSIAALVSGVLVSASLYVLARFFYTVFAELNTLRSEMFAMLMLLGVLTVLFGETVALVQRDYRRMLGYSSIGAAGIILIGLISEILYAFIGALLLIVAHGFAKVPLFMMSKHLEENYGTRDMEKVKGAFKANPKLAIPLVAGSLTILGMPPFLGFWGKLLLIYGLALKYPIIALIILLASIVEAAYYLRMLHRLVIQDGELKKQIKIDTVELVTYYAFLALLIILGILPMLLSPYLAGAFIELSNPSFYIKVAMGVMGG
ncbi:MAG: hypothetical protein B6U76_06470 [Desulfurococcales archaeon ex4484_217_2]|nr:MAG: hypothetical protein B6U76_06470 [Desulfurococcales archaeon ex4484_217_2]